MHIAFTCIDNEEHFQFDHRVVQEMMRIGLKMQNR